MNNIDFTDRQIEIMEAATLRIDQFGIQELTIKNLSADLNLSEAALYRHFKSKNDILLGLLTYFIVEMKDRISQIMSNEDLHPSEILMQILVTIPMLKLILMKRVWKKRECMLNNKVMI